MVVAVTQERAVGRLSRARIEHAGTRGQFRAEVGYDLRDRGPWMGETETNALIDEGSISA